MSIPLTKETTSLLQADTQDCFLWIKDLLHLLFTLIAFQIVLKTKQKKKKKLPMSLTDFSSGAAASLSQCSSCRDTSDAEAENIDAKYEK